MNPSGLYGLSLATGIISSAALAQAQPTPPLQAFIASAQYQAYVGRLFSKLPPDLFQLCSSLVSKGSTVAVLTPVVFAIDGNPISGAWQQSFPISGCGNDTTIKFYFAAEKDGNIVTRLGTPGGTHADLDLQKDALKFVILRLKAATCPTPYVINTTYDGVVSKRLCCTTRGRSDACFIWKYYATRTVLGVPICEQQLRIAARTLSSVI